MKMNWKTMGGITVIVAVIAFGIVLIPEMFKIHPFAIYSVEVVRLDIDDFEFGNGDGKLNPGERVKIWFYLKNIGQDSIPPSSPTLFTSQSGIAIIDSVAYFPGVAVGDTVRSSDCCEFYADTTFAALGVAFNLTAIHNSEIQYQVPIFVASYTDIYACIETCKILSPTKANPELVIQLSICNNSNVNLVGVAAHIPASKIQKCNQTLSFVAIKNSQGIVLDKAFYTNSVPMVAGNVDHLRCAAAENLPTKEFRFMIKGNLGNVSCIYFPVKIYTGATRNLYSSIDLSGATLRNEVSLGYKFKHNAQKNK